MPIPERVDKMVIDFAGRALDGLDLASGVEPVVDVRGGRIAGDVSARPVLGTGRWRLSFDFASEPHASDPVEIRAWLRRNGQAITETWLGQATTDRRSAIRHG
jgi:glucans biosynthesis protein